MVKGDTDETDLWQPVRDVDFCDFPAISAGYVAPASSDLSDAMQPAEPAQVPGYERFTLGLMRSKEAIAIAHARVAAGPVAALSNVTIARAAPILIEEKGTAAFYQLSGRELYVRARVISTKPHPNPYQKGDVEMAWTQPVTP